MTVVTVVATTLCDRFHHADEHSPQVMDDHCTLQLIDNHTDTLQVYVRHLCAAVSIPSGVILVHALWAVAVRQL